MKSRERMNKIYSSIYKHPAKGVSVGQLRAWHHVSKSTVYKYLRLIYTKEGLPVEKKDGRWFYFNPEKRLKQRDDTVKARSKELEEEHKRLIKEGGSLIMDDIEEYYHSDYRANVASKIRRISKLSLDDKEKEHIIHHLGL